MTTWSIENYFDAKGRSPVEEFLDRLPVVDRARADHTIGLLREFGLQLNLPYTRHLEGKLWELRTSVGYKEYRVIYFAFTGRRFVLLHAFSKKTPKTPKGELAVARARLADFLEAEG